MQMSYLNSTHFSDQNSYKIPFVSNYGLKDMLYTTYAHFLEFRKTGKTFHTKAWLATENDSGASVLICKTEQKGEDFALAGIGALDFTGRGTGANQCAIDSDFVQTWVLPDLTTLQAEARTGCKRQQQKKEGGASPRVRGAALRGARMRGRGGVAVRAWDMWVRACTCRNLCVRACKLFHPWRTLQATTMQEGNNREGGKGSSAHHEPCGERVRLGNAGEEENVGEDGDVQALGRT
jgi:hypothetical protein